MPSARELLASETEVIGFRKKRTLEIRRRLRWFLENLKAVMRGTQW
jgi:hypothetical protein